MVRWVYSVCSKVYYEQLCNLKGRNTVAQKSRAKHMELGTCLGFQSLFNSSIAQFVAGFPDLLGYSAKPQVNASLALIGALEVTTELGAWVFSFGVCCGCCDL